VIAELLSGPRSVRVRDERRSLALSISLAPLTILLIGTFFHEVSISAVVLLIIGGLVFVSVTRGRLLGASIHVHAGHFPEIFAAVERVAARLGVPVPQIFVRDDVFVPVAALGTGEPYALVFSNYYVEHFTEAELEFLAARELAHIAAGHTRLTSLLSASGRENPVNSLVFGMWLRRTEYTADRVALVATGSLDAALSAISIVTFHTLGRKIDMDMLIEQQREIDADPGFRMGEWASASPYATSRIIALREFAATDLAQSWIRSLATVPAPAAQPAEPAGLPLDGLEANRRQSLAPPSRRIAAFAIDLVAIAAAFNAGFDATVSDRNGKNTKGLDELVDSIPPDATVDAHHFLAWLTGLVHSSAHITLDFGAPLIYVVYAALLTGLNGQTLGMMILNMRVVDTKFERIGFAQSAWRYVAAVLTCLAVPLAPALRVLPHDYLSRSRVVASGPAPRRGRLLRTLARTGRKSERLRQP
jgi:Zn-dependent protease with chaperone function